MEVINTEKENRQIFRDDKGVVHIVDVSYSDDVKEMLSTTKDDGLLISKINLNCVEEEYVKIPKKDLDAIFGNWDINEVLALLVEIKYQDQYPEMKDKKYLRWTEDELVYAINRMEELMKESHKKEII